MRTSRAIVVLIAIVAIIGLGQPAGAQYPPAPTISVSPATVGPGGSVNVAGSGCDAGSAVTVTIGSQSSSTTADGDGNFSTTVTAPTAPGTYEVTATCGRISSHASVTVMGSSSTVPQAQPSLPVTGKSSGPLVLGGIALVVAGGLLVLATRKRRNATIA